MTFAFPGSKRSPSARASTRIPFALLAAALMAVLPGAAPAQERPFWEQDSTYGDQRRPSQPTATRGGARRDDAYRPPENNMGPAGGFGQQAGPDGRPPYDGPQQYGAPPPSSGGYPTSAQAYDPRYEPQQPTYSPPPQVPGQPGYADPRYSGPQQVEPWRDRGGPAGRNDDAYRPPAPQGQADNRGWSNEPQQGYGYQGDNRGNGQPTGAPPQEGYGQAYQQPDRYGSQDQRGWDERRGTGTYSQNEVVDTGHRFFGSISEGLARAVERVFRSQGRPNGYILGEDAGGAFVAGLRYGEGTMFTKDVGTHKVYWQGPSLGYDFGGEGSKTMVLVYNLRDPSDIYSRFGGVQGAAYVIGGVSVQFQTHEHVTLAVIRSGIGLRLGANVGYLKYTRRPTWNPF